VFRLRSKYEVQVKFEKVAGHHLKHLRYDQLTRPEQLNEDMDVLAKARVDRIFEESLPKPPSAIKFEGWTCWIDEIKLVHDPTARLLRRLYEPAMRDWLSREDHYRMSPEGFDLVDWDSVAASLSGFFRNVQSLGR
jgi:hypothetical protein